MKWLTKYWKTLLATIYLVVIVIDFIIIPSYILHHHEEITSLSYYRNVREIFKDNNEAISIILSDRDTGDWTPFSLRSGGLLHISLGAILGVTALNGKKKE